MDLGDFITVIAAYVLGATPFAVLISRAFGLSDPRSFGSGNPGATNVARHGNKTAAALTLCADMAKGFVPVWLSDGNVALAAGIAAVTGHVCSVFLRFGGGKGVATALGVFVAWHWAAGAAAVAVWGIIFATFRISSLASIVAIIAAAIVLWVAHTFAAALVGTALAVLIIARHRRNIVNLMRGQEKQLARRPLPSSIVRLALAGMVLGGLVLTLVNVHDYSTTRRQINLIRQGDETAVQRPWIAMFFFFNEAGSGMKYKLTGNSKHMRHYPTYAYLYELQTARARNNQWHAQMLLAKRFYIGATVDKNQQTAILWLQRALENAPPAERPAIVKLLQQWEYQMPIDQDSY